MTGYKKVFFAALMAALLLNGSLSGRAIVLGQVSAPRLDPASDRGFVYALLNGGSGVNNQIYGFSLNPIDGVLTALPGFPVATGGSGDNNPSSLSADVIPERLVYDPAFHRLYALNGSRSLSVFQVNPGSGKLSALPYSPIALVAKQPWCVRVNAAGSVVIVGEASGLNGSGTLQAFVISNSSANQASGSPYDTGVTQPSSCTFSQDGNYYYMGGGDLNNNLAGFSVNAVSGVLTALAGSPFDSGAVAPQGFASDSLGRLFVSHGSFNAGLRAFTTTSGIPSPVSGNPFSPALNSGSTLMHPMGYYLLADRGSFITESDGLIYVFQVNGTGAATTLTHVSGSPFSTGGKVSISVALSGAGGLLLAANASTRNLTAFAIDPATGVLTQRSFQPANTLGNSGKLNGVAFAAQVFYTFLPDVLR